MIPRIHTLSLCLVAVLALVGCTSTGELAKNEASTCEVHECPTNIQVVDCAPGGFSDYTPEFDTARWTQFPHHGRIHFLRTTVTCMRIICGRTFALIAPRHTTNGGRSTQANDDTC